MSKYISNRIIPGESTLGLITLNRPQKLNALNYEMLKEITRLLIEWENDSSIDAVVINSSCERAFCAGGDIKSIYDNGIEKVVDSIEFFRTEYSLNELIFRYRKPYIALLNGISMGGGLGISLHGSYRIAKKNLRLAMPETKIGFYTDIGASNFLNKLPSPFDLHLALSGDEINSNTASFLGVIDCILDENDFDDAINILSSQTIETISDKEKIHNVFSRKNCSSEDEITFFDKEYLSALQQKSLHVIWKLALESDHKVLSSLSLRSPLSLAICLELLKRTKSLSFRESMQLDFNLTQSYIRDTEFYEGIKALLVEKRAPKWTYKISDITNDVLDSFFTGQGKEELIFHD